MILMNDFLNSKNHKKFIQPRVNKLVKSGFHQSYYEQAFATLIEKNSFPIKVIKFDNDAWYEIDTIEDLEEAKKLFRKN